MSPELTYNNYALSMKNPVTPIKEGFGMTSNNTDFASSSTPQLKMVQNGDYVSGMNDSASYVATTNASINQNNDYANSGYTNTYNTTFVPNNSVINLQTSLSPSQTTITANPGNQEYKTIPTDFSSLAGNATEQAKLQANRQWNITKNKNDSQTYTLPKELLPIPDMRNEINRDVSDPS